VKANGRRSGFARACARATHCRRSRSRLCIWRIWAQVVS